MSTNEKASPFEQAGRFSRKGRFQDSNALIKMALADW
jgi:hypothetical protein